MQFYQHKFSAMGSPCSLNFYFNDPKIAQQLYIDVFNEVKRLEDKYSRYQASSLLTQINKSAGKSHVSIDVETHALLAYADQAYKISDGLFDITTGVLRRAWDFKSGIIPTQDKIDNCLSFIGWNKVDWQQKSIYLPQEGMEIDFGGIVKEYAADAVAALLKSNGVKHGLIDLGGDIHVIGPDLQGQPWSIGIRSPESSHKAQKKKGKLPRNPVEKALAHIPMTNGGLASSGDYERNLIVNGKKYSHLLNPKTGWPVHGLSAVSVWCEQCVMAGTIATITMLKENEGIEWLSALELPFVAMDHLGNSYSG